MSSARTLLTFRRGNASYAVDVGEVRRVVSAVELRTLPATPAFVAGAARIDDRLEVMVDPEALFSGNPATPDAARIILVTALNQPLGLLADDVDDVATVPADEIAPPLPFVGGRRPGAVAGVLSRTSAEVLVLDLARLLTSSEVTELIAPTTPAAD
ncbi:MAG: hypothetical protein DHS20C21_06710 [Gemmatimonadota bacterium]|nr:MAG: hypothetical protein DHS20C21_06710 [Gemmatimonadota bacterium]